MTARSRVPLTLMTAAEMAQRARELALVLRELGDHRGRAADLVRALTRAHFDLEDEGPACTLGGMAMRINADALYDVQEATMLERWADALERKAGEGATPPEEVAGDLLPIYPLPPSPEATKRVQAALAGLGLPGTFGEGYAAELLCMGAELGKGPGTVLAAIAWVNERIRQLQHRRQSLSRNEIAGILVEQSAIRFPSLIRRPCRRRGRLSGLRPIPEEVPPEQPEVHRETRGGGHAPRSELAQRLQCLLDHAWTLFPDLFDRPSAAAVLVLADPISLLAPALGMPAATATNGTWITVSPIGEVCAALRTAAAGSTYVGASPKRLRELAADLGSPEEGFVYALAVLGGEIWRLRLRIKWRTNLARSNAPGGTA